MCGLRDYNRSEETSWEFRMWTEEILESQGILEANPWKSSRWAGWVPWGSGWGVWGVVSDESLECES